MMQTFMAAPVASAIFILTILTSLMAFSNEELLSKFILHPYTVYRKKNLYTLFTSGLIHNDWMHLIFNMFSYFFFAFNLEPIIGHWQFAVLYIVSLAASDLPTIFKHKDDYRYHSLGASGAVSAVIFGSILYNPWATMMILPIPVPIWYFAFGVLYLVYCHYAARYARDNVNHDAHLFGAVCGLALTIILHPSVVHSFFQQIIEGARYHLHF
jgi:membrane associated rhomboid family serine protease